MESPWVSTVWPEVRDDCQIAISPNFLVSAPLWQAGMPLAAERTWSDLRTLLGTPEHAERWAFWLHWYAGFLDPNAPETRPDWDMLEEIALIDPKVWDAGPDTVMPVINEIWEKYTPRQQSTLDLVDGALFTFRLDEVDRVLRAVPLPRDWEKLTDPNQLTAFLASAADVQDSLETLSEALRVGGDRPNLIATQLATYVDKAVNELRQAPELAELNAAKLLEWARVLESGTSESTLAELGVVAVPFEIAVEKLRDLIRRHFAGMLARMVDLRAIRTEEGVNPHRVLSEIREIVATARSGNGGRAYPLSPEDAAVLDDMLESVDHALLRQAGAETAEHKESAGRDADFTQSKVLATVESYRSKAASLLHRGDANADTVLKYKKKGEGLWALGQGVADLLNKLGGPPPT